MKLFITWSGAYSNAIAVAIKEWLPLVLNGVDTFVSSEDIRKGTRWAEKIGKELETSNFGIACLTPDNLDARWLLFEAGALSKQLKDSALCTLLFGGLTIANIQDPLRQFHHTIFNKEDFYELLKSIETNNPSKQEERILEEKFEMFWSKLEAEIAKIPKTDGKPVKTLTTDEILNQLLERVEYIARNVSPVTPAERLLRETAPSISDEQQKRFWGQFMTRAAKISPLVANYLREAYSGKFDPDGFTIYFPESSKHLVAAISNDENRQLLRGVLIEMGIPEDMTGINFVIVSSNLY